MTYPAGNIELDDPELKARLQSSDASIRRIALMDLAEEEDENLLPFLQQALRHDEAAVVRQEAARLLAGWDDAGVADALCHALADSDKEVRLHAAQSLSELKEADSGKVLLPWTRHAEAFVRAASLRALRELRLPEAFDPALHNLQDSDALVRREAVGVLGWLKQDAALTEISRLAESDTDAEVRRAATGALGYAQGQLRATTVLTALLRTLSDEVWQVREEAAATLGKLRISESAEDLIAALQDSYWQVRLQAARSLGKLRDKRATTELLLTLTHSISNLRKEAALALGEIGDVAALPALQTASNDADPEVRKAVRIALAQLQA